MQEHWYSDGSTGTLYLFLTYVEVDLLSWGGRHSRGNFLVSLLDNNHRNKAFSVRTGVIIRTNAIGALLQHADPLLKRYQYADYYYGVPVRWWLLWHTSTQVLDVRWHTSTLVMMLLAY